MCNTGGPRELLHRRFELFQNACDLAWVDLQDTDMMLQVIPTTFLSEPAFVYFPDIIKHKATSVEEVLQQLESQFLSARVKSVNDQVWEQLTFNFVLQKRKFEKKIVTFQLALRDFTTEISELADMRGWPRQ